MPRKSKSSPLEDIVDIIAWFPWWVGVLIAVIGYWILSTYASFNPIRVSINRPDKILSTLIFPSAALVLQYLVPMAGLTGALISFIKRKQRSDLIANVAQARSVSALEGITWSEFEKLVGEAFRLQGFKVTETGGTGPDGGVDLELTRGGEQFLVQCKQWRSYKVGVDIVRQLYGVMASRGASGGFVVTSGLFTHDAQDFANGLNVELIDGEKLIKMILLAKESLASKIAAPLAPQTTSKAELTSTPACPKCNALMIKRRARQGSNAGLEFWGCSNFPTCRGIRTVSD